MPTEGQRQSRRHEERLAASLGGQRSAGSGSFWSRKNDVRTDDLCIEHKWTAAKSFSVKRSTFDTLEHDALKDSRIPVLALSIDGRDYWVLTEDDAVEWYRAWSEAREK